MTVVVYTDSEFVALEVLSHSLCTGGHRSQPKVQNTLKSAYQVVVLIRPVRIYLPKVSREITRNDLTNQNPLSDPC